PDVALEMMIEDPLLIRRPLMQVGERRESGFNQPAVDAWIGINASGRPVTDVCLKRELRAAPQPSRIAAVQGGSSAAIQALLGEFAERLARRGRKIAGVVEFAGSESGGSCGQLAVRDLSTGAITSISQNLGPGSASCNLDPAGLAQACSAIQQSIGARPDLVVLSKFGKTEAQRGGLSDAFRAAIEAELPILTAVSPSMSEAWNLFAGPLSEFLPADIGALDAWWARIETDALPARK
ncbi:MAG: DUF2478 domain-containing protein, partial [Alphaproteobacteria bacterium]